MKEYIAFDWTTAHGSQQRIDWLKANHDKKITEEQYLEHIKQLPHDHPKASRCRGSSHNKKDYAYLKKRFGFFGADDE